jgi:hypothetical protein
MNNDVSSAKLDLILPNGMVVVVYEDNVVLVYESYKGPKVGYDNKNKPLFKFGKCLMGATYDPLTKRIMPHIGSVGPKDYILIEHSLKQKIT